MSLGALIFRGRSALLRFVGKFPLRVDPMATFQHYVPRFYLKGFLDTSLEKRTPPQRVLWLYRAHKRSLRCSIVRVAGEYGFYEHESGDNLDKQLTKAEAVWAQLLEKILKDGKLSGTDRKEFARFIGLISTRGKWFFNMTTEVLRLTESYVTTRCNSPEQTAILRERLATGGIVPRLSRKRTLEEMLETGEYLAMLYDQMNWFIARTGNDDYFVTSDTPVSLTDPNGPITTPTSYQYSNKAEFSFPLDRSHMILGSAATGVVANPIRGYEVRKLNRRTIARAYKLVFASVNSVGLTDLVDKIMGTEKPVVDVPKLFRSLDEELAIENRSKSKELQWKSWLSG